MPESFAVVITRETEFERIQKLEAGNVVIGREESCEISLADSRVSPLHARLRILENAISICDLGSQNGTLVDGQPIRAEKVLRPGAEIKIGPYSLQLCLSSPNKAGTGCEQFDQTRCNAKTSEVPVPFLLGVPSRKATRLSIDGDSSTNKTGTGSEQFDQTCCNAKTSEVPVPFLLGVPGREATRPSVDSDSSTRNETTQKLDVKIDGRPRWDGERATLFVGEHVVKKFLRPAPSQQLILAAFEEEGWAYCIDDPLVPPAGRSQPRIKQRLRSAVQDLNRAQHGRVRIRFTLDGTGSGIRWKADIE